MRIVVFGLSISSSWGNGHATLWRGLCRALRRLGHHVTFFEKDTPYYASERDFWAIEGGDLRIYPAWESVRAEAHRAVTGADAVLVTSYCPDARAATELVLDSNAAARVFYDLDTPVTLARLRAGREVEYLGSQGLKGFDAVLSFASGPALTELTTRLGAKRVYALHGGVDADAYRPRPPRAEYRANLSYLGTFSPDRQSAVAALLFEPAERRREERFVVGGSLYPDDLRWPANVHAIGHVAPRFHAEFYSSSPLTLNLTRAPMMALGHCPSGRLFEATACGTAVLTDAWEGVETFFTPGREILVARTTDDVLEALSRPPAELAAIGLAARERTLREHTAADRAATLIQILEDTTGGR